MNDHRCPVCGLATFNPDSCHWCAESERRRKVLELLDSVMDPTETW